MARCERCGKDEGAKKYNIRSGVDRVLCKTCYREVISGGGEIRQNVEKINQDRGGRCCPNCGAALAEGAKFCTSCGAKIEELVVEKGKARYCSECGSKLEGNPKFCSECGNKLV